MTAVCGGAACERTVIPTYAHSSHKNTPCPGHANGAGHTHAAAGCAALRRAHRGGHDVGGLAGVAIRGGHGGEQLEQHAARHVVVVGVGVAVGHALGCRRGKGGQGRAVVG